MLGLGYNSRTEDSVSPAGSSLSGLHERFACLHSLRFLQLPGSSLPWEAPWNSRLTPSWTESWGCAWVCAWCSTAAGAERGTTAQSSSETMHLSGMGWKPGGRVGTCRRAPCHLALTIQGAFLEQYHGSWGNRGTATQRAQGQPASSLTKGVQIRVTRSGYTEAKATGGD